MRVYSQRRVNSVVHLSVPLLRPVVQAPNGDFAFALASPVEVDSFLCTLAVLILTASSADLVPDAHWSPGAFEDHAQAQPYTVIVNLVHGHTST